MHNKFILKEELKLFSTGFIQVLFVAINTVFLSREYYIGVFICGFIISMIWSWNVKKIVFGTTYDRLFYSLGAALGSLTGLYISTSIIKIIQCLS